MIVERNQEPCMVTALFQHECFALSLHQVSSWRPLLKLRAPPTLNEISTRMRSLA